MSPVITPEILAPAGDKASFLAAVAAGADAVYCGMKQFSARMQAKNFAFSELSSLTRLAHAKGVRVYVAFNTVIRPDELDEAGKRLVQLAGEVQPDALIVQDPGVLELTRQVGFPAVYKPLFSTWFEISNNAGNLAWVMEGYHGDADDRNGNADDRDEGNVKVTISGK